MLSAIFLIISLFLIFFLKNRLLSFLLLSVLFFYFVAYDLRKELDVLELFEFAKVTDYEIYLIYGFAIGVSVLIILIADDLLSKKLEQRKHDTSDIEYKENTLKAFYYCFSLLSIVATVINFSHVNYSFALLLISPREYEIIFGSSTAINYLYFLNVPALCIYIYVFNKLNKGIRFGKMLNFLLIIVSIFHGVKFTVFDTVLIPLFFYYYSTPKAINYRKLSLIIILLLAFYFAFSTFVRGGTGSPIEQILSYILPNYYNLAYSLQTTPFQWDGFNIILPDKLPSFFDQFYNYGPGGFMLNDKYNMQTAYINYYRFGWLFGPLIFLGIVAWIRRYFKYQSIDTLIRSFILAYIDYCLLFAFFFNAFSKTKYVYYIFLIILIHKLAIKAPRKELVDEVTS